MIHGVDVNWQTYLLKPALPRRKMDLRSFYLTMEDGIEIALDLYLPKQLPEKARIPVILRATRYFRAFKMRWPFNYFSGSIDEIERCYLANGYGFVVVDTRGSGASFGYRPCPWSPEEIHDLVEVVDWIIEQPWSNGNVGALGTSYDGTTAELLAAAGHPALKAIMPRFSLFDAYGDVSYPGGIHSSWFTRVWAQGNSAMDRNAVGELPIPWWQKLMVLGVKPVDEDKNSVQLGNAVESHSHNWDPHETTLSTQYSDDKFYHDPEMGVDIFSPCSYVGNINKSGTAVYSYSGWFDGAYQRSAINRHLSLSNKDNRLIIGPWNHGGRRHSGSLGQCKTAFDHVAEQIRFFDYHLKDLETGIESDDPVHYFTLGEEKWKSCKTWPPEAEITPFYFEDGNILHREKPQVGDGFDKYFVDYTAGTGASSRWNCLMDGRPVAYPDRRHEDQKLLTYNSGPLVEAMEVTGHPLLTLYISSTANDGDFIVYLEDVEPDGRVTYVTEGQLRAIHHKLTERPSCNRDVRHRTFKRDDAQPLKPGEVTELVFDLLPTSYLFRQGHSIRIAIAGADKDHFTIKTVIPPMVQIYRNTIFPSHISLPIVPTGSLEIDSEILKE